MRAIAIPLLTLFLATAACAVEDGAVDCESDKCDERASFSEHRRAVLECDDALAADSSTYRFGLWMQCLMDANFAAARAVDDLSSAESYLAVQRAGEAGATFCRTFELVVTEGPAYEECNGRLDRLVADIIDSLVDFDGAQRVDFDDHRSDLAECYESHDRLVDAGEDGDGAMALRECARRLVDGYRIDLVDALLITFGDGAGGSVDKTLDRTFSTMRAACEHFGGLIDPSSGRNRLEETNVCVLEATSRIVGLIEEALASVPQETNRESP